METWRLRNVHVKSRMKPQSTGLLTLNPIPFHLATCPTFSYYYKESELTLTLGLSWLSQNPALELPSWGGYREFKPFGQLWLWKPLQLFCFQQGVLKRRFCYLKLKTCRNGFTTPFIQIRGAVFELFDLRSFCLKNWGPPRSLYLCGLYLWIYHIKT